jgi:hypothetical protein
MVLQAVVIINTAVEVAVLVQQDPAAVEVMAQHRVFLVRQ